LNINSDTTPEGNTYAYESMDSLNSIYSLVVYGIILSMSYGYMTENYEIVVSLLVVALIFNNVQYSNMNTSTLQSLTDNAYTYTLNKHKILGPIKIVASLGMLATLFTGNLFAWGTYLCFIGVSIIMTNVYKKQLGVVSKDAKL